MTGSAAQLRVFAGDFVRFAGRDLWRAVPLVLLGAVLEGFGLLLLLPLLTLMLDGGGGGGVTGDFARGLLAWLPAGSRSGRLALLLALFAAVMAVRALVLFRRDVLLARLQIDFVRDRRNRVVALLAGSRWDVVARLRHARIHYLLGGDVHALRTAVLFLIQLCVAATMLVAQCILALLLSPLLALLLFGLLAVGAVALAPLLRRARRLGARASEANLRLVGSTGHFLGGLKLAMSQDLQQRFVEEFGDTLADASQRELEMARQRSISQIALTGLAAAVAGLAVFVGITITDTAPAALLALLVVVGRMNGPATQIQHGAQHIVASLPVYAQVKALERELGDAQRESRPAPGAAGERVAGAITFQGVHFRHPEANRDEGAAGVAGVELAIEAGEFVGIAGESGAGKTTLADLMVGLYPPQAGRIMVGGEPLDGQRLPNWRASVGYVSQDPFLFHDTIRRNLLWAATNPTDEAALWEALRCAGAEDLVRGMEQGLDTVVGERGTLVSGGERQRIALARALLRRPSLLVLDEATNAIDVTGEAALLDRLRSRFPDMTIVMIAHRPTSLARCDRILTVAGGRIAGSSAELLDA